MHSVRYYDGLFYRLQKQADASGYHIDSDPDYIAACTVMPSSQCKKAPVEILPLLYRVGERIESVRKWREK